MSKLEFGIDKTPPTQEQIEAARAAVRSSSRRMKKLSVCVVFIGLVVAVALQHWQAEDSPAIPIFLGAAVCGFFFWNAGSDTLFDLFDLTVLDRGDCADMRRYCNASDATKAYHRAVLQQGREFVHAEFNMMSRASADARKLEQCKALYEVPV